MTLTTGARLGVYEILGPLGSGGMGEVYRARDSKLKRDVAIKVLPDAFAEDMERVSRFQREAELLASLNHPNIAQIYGQEESGGRRCLVLEFVDGETIQDRLRRGAIPMEEALEFARQIALALEAAHDQGIVHRDLKPANVKITPDGQVKVLDFGLAKALEPEPAEDFSNSPTLFSGRTQGGVILGTSGYMSPEQARGKPADARADIWSFGVVLYEMLSGRQAFAGDTVVEVLSNVLKTDPDWTALPPATAPLVRSLVRRCLQRDRSSRVRNIADVRIEIEEALREPEMQSPAAKPAPPASRERWWMVATLISLAGVAILGFLYVRTASVEMSETRLEIMAPPGRLSFFAISPDGRKVVFQATVQGKTQLWLRSLDSETARPLPGTEGGAGPFWSPDSRSIAFDADSKLKRIDIAGGAPLILANKLGSIRGTWNSGGAILFTPSSTSGLFSVPAGGGTPVEVTKLAGPDEASHRLPHFLPDGRRFLFFVAGTTRVQGVFLGSLDNKVTRRLFDADSGAMFAPPGYLLFRRQQTLVAQRVDLGTLELTGEPFSVADTVSGDEGTLGELAVSVSEAGVIGYRVPLSSRRQLVWVDRTGRQNGKVGDIDFDDRPQLRVSPDGRTIASRRVSNGNLDVWVIEIARGLLRRITSDPAAEGLPVWSPDSSRIAFFSRRSGPQNIWSKSIDGAPEEHLLESSENQQPSDWSHDGNFILYDNNGSQDIWALPLQGDKKPFAVAQSEFAEASGAFSPDDRWVAYQSNETGRNEIFVRRFPGPGGLTQISNSGGSDPSWRGDGREIIYIDPGGRIMAAPVTVQANGRIEARTPTVLFTLPSGTPVALAPDGRFLVANPVGDAVIPPITLILNWKPPPR